MPANAILHVGDSLEADVRGAKAMDMRTVWVNRTGEPIRIDDTKPDFVVSDLGALVPLLRRNSLL